MIVEKTEVIAERAQGSAHLHGKPLIPNKDVQRCRCSVAFADKRYPHTLPGRIERCVTGNHFASVYRRSPICWASYRKQRQPGTLYPSAHGTDGLKAQYHYPFIIIEQLGKKSSVNIHCPLAESFALKYTACIPDL